MTYNKKDLEYVSILERMAMTVQPVRKARFASCLVLKNEIVSFGVNQLKTHPIQAKFSKNKESIFLHAEIDCIKNAIKFISMEDLQKATLYVCRVKWESTDRRRFVWGNACPCKGCSDAIKWFGIKRVVYTENPNEIGVYK